MTTTLCSIAYRLRNSERHLLSLRSPHRMTVTMTTPRRQLLPYLAETILRLETLRLRKHLFYTLRETLLPKFLRCFDPLRWMTMQPVCKKSNASNLQRLFFG